MENEIIKLKGTGDGVKIYLDPGTPFADILIAVQQKLRAWRKFFGTGHCNMYFTGRELTKSDKLRLETVVGGLLPESTVIYGEKKGLSDTTELPEEFMEELKNTQTTEKTADTEPVDKDIEQFMAIKEVVTTNFKSNRARLYEGYVSSGKTVESDGHLILVGDVGEGGKLVASGNVIVLGSLYGSVTAGLMGNDAAYVIALDLMPTDIRIANVHTEFDADKEGGGFKKAYLTENTLRVDNFFVKPVDKNE